MVEPRQAPVRTPHRIKIRRPSETERAERVRVQPDGPCGACASWRGPAELELRRAKPDPRHAPSTPSRSPGAHLGCYRGSTWRSPGGRHSCHERNASPIHGTEVEGAERERMMGLEPTTFCMASRRSSQLSYIRVGASIALVRAHHRPAATRPRAARSRREDMARAPLRLRPAPRSRGGRRARCAHGERGGSRRCRASAPDEWPRARAREAPRSSPCTHRASA